MPDSNEFIDYYAVLQVNPNCDVRIIESAYRHLAKVFHPDHEETADVERFSAVVDAYNVLKFPKKRARYDTVYNAYKQGDPAIPDAASSGDSAASDAAMQQNILLYLYRRKRENFQELGIAAFYVQKHFGCYDNVFDFHMWYLKSKGFVEITEQGTLAITVVGVDHVLAIHQPKHAEKLLTDQTDHAVG
jgi:curved DNA-binding protein